MTNCEVKRAKQSEELEVELKSKSKLEGSERNSMLISLRSGNP